jgi:uncharacterized protein DUF4292
MKIFFYFLICSVIVFASGCRSAKKIQKAITVPRQDTVKPQVVTADPHADSLKFINDAFNRLQKNKIDFKTFSAKMKVNYEGSDGKGYDFTAFMHIQKDSIIWIRVEAILGVEAFRILITPDSLKMISKFGKTKGLIMRSVSYLREVTGVPLDFKTIQDLLIGNPIYLDSNIVVYNNEPAGISLLSVGDLFKNYITLNKNDYTTKHAKLDDVDVMRARTCDLTYQDYEQRDTIRFSTYRKISIAEKSKLDIEISYKQYNFNEALSFPFPLPKNYKRK